MIHMSTIRICCFVDRPWSITSHLSCNWCTQSSTVFLFCLDFWSRSRRCSWSSLRSTMNHTGMVPSLPWYVWRTTEFRFIPLHLSSMPTSPVSRELTGRCGGQREMCLLWGETRWEDVEVPHGWCSYSEISMFAYQLCMYHYIGITYTSGRTNCVCIHYIGITYTSGPYQLCMYTLHRYYLYQWPLPTVYVYIT